MSQPPAHPKFSGLIFSDAVPWRGSADQRQMLKGVMKVMHYIFKKWDIKARIISINWQVNELQLVSCVCLATTGKCLFGLDFTPWSCPPWKVCLRSREQWQSPLYSKALQLKLFFFFNRASKTHILDFSFAPDPLSLESKESPPHLDARQLLGWMTLRLLLRLQQSRPPPAS